MVDADKHQDLAPRAVPVYRDLRGRQANVPDEFLRDSVPEVRWKNPTDHVIKVEIFMGTPEARGPGRGPRNHQEKTGLRTYVWQPGEIKSLDAELTQGIQRLQCTDPECSLRPFDCRPWSNPLQADHQHLVVGGLAPQLENLGIQRRPRLHDHLNDELAAAEAAKMREFEAWKRQQAASNEHARAAAALEAIEKKQAEAGDREMRELEAATAPSNQQKPTNKK